jgi:hypothetical protein
LRLPNCDICGQPVTTIDRGAVWVSYRAISEREERLADWQRLHSGDVVSAADLATHPERVDWTWAHIDCPDPDGDNIYWFEATRFGTTADALAWTVHLLEKTWLPSTDWETLVRRLHDLPNP